MKHDEYHRQFADRVIEQIRQGTAPWQKPWGPGERVLPANVDTGRSYSGGNSLHLADVAQSRGYADVRWGTPSASSSSTSRMPKRCTWTAARSWTRGAWRRRPRSRRRGVASTRRSSPRGAT